MARRSLTVSHDPASVLTSKFSCALSKRALGAANRFNPSPRNRRMTAAASFYHWKPLQAPAGPPSTGGAVPPVQPTGWPIWPDAQRRPIARSPSAQTGAPKHYEAAPAPACSTPPPSPVICTGLRARSQSAPARWQYEAATVILLLAARGAGRLR